VLTIGVLAERTGVPQATLRSWESRYGFPSPTRLPGGHRRYTEADVAAVLDVLRHRRAGLALEVAVRQVTAATTESGSLYAEVRRRHSDLPSQLVSQPAMMALSRAIEDECCAQATRPVLLASFQRRRFYRASYTRWTELARTARAAVVFADFADPRPVAPAMPVEVAVPYDAPLNREWSVVCDAPDRPACLVGWERPGEDKDSDRRFEAFWSVDPQVVRDTARIAAGLADGYRPGWRDGDDGWFGDVPAAASDDLRRASALMNRVVGYLDAAR
jgi:MerR family transcriptional regulator, light-induced transcriptional regulator